MGIQGLGEKGQRDMVFRDDVGVIECMGGVWSVLGRE